MFMTRENCSEILRKELQNYRRYAMLIRDSEDRLAELENESNNLRSPRMDRIGDNTGTMEFDLLRYVQLMDTERETIDAYTRMQEWVLGVVNGIENKSLKPDLIRIFFRGERRKVVARDRGIREDLLNKQILNEFQKAVTDEQIKQYNEISEKLSEINEL